MSQKASVITPILTGKVPPKQAFSRVHNACNTGVDYIVNYVESVPDGTDSDKRGLWKSARADPEPDVVVVGVCVKLHVSVPSCVRMGRF